MIKEISQIVNELIATSFIQDSPVFKLAAKAAYCKEVIKNHTLSAEQKNLLVDFLRESNIDYSDCNDAKIIRLALQEIENKSNDFYLATRNLYNDNCGYDPDQNPFSDLNDTLYENLFRYVDLIEPRLGFEEKDIVKFRTRVIEVLARDFNYLTNLFGMGVKFDYNYRLAKNHHIAPIPKFIITDICQKFHDTPEKHIRGLCG